MGLCAFKFMVSLCVIIIQLLLFFNFFFTLIVCYFFVIDFNFVQWFHFALLRKLEKFYIYNYYPYLSALCTAICFPCTILRNSPALLQSYYSQIFNFYILKLISFIFPSAICYTCILICCQICILYLMIYQNYLSSSG